MKNKNTNWQEKDKLVTQKQIGNKNTNLQTNSNWQHKYNMTTQIQQGVTQIQHGYKNAIWQNKYKLAGFKKICAGLLQYNLQFLYRNSYYQ